MNKFEFEFGKYKEIYELYYSGKKLKTIIWYDGNLEATLYDAYIGVSVSLANIFDYYVQTEQHGGGQVPIKHFVLEKLALLAYNKLKPSKLLNPIGGKPHYKFYPYGSLNFLNETIFKNFKVLHPKYSNKKIYNALNEFLKKGENLVGEDLARSLISLRAIEKNLKLYYSRKTRLDKVQKILNRFYPLREQRNTLTKSLETEKDTELLKAIQFKLETIELKWQSLIKRLDEIYKNPAQLV